MMPKFAFACFFLITATIICLTDAFDKLCFNENNKISCDANAKYRTADGSCNNLKYKWWGRSLTPYQRKVTPVYDDGKQAARRKAANKRDSLPNPRSISLAVHYSADKSTYKNTNLFAMLGQSIGQDILGYKDSRGPSGQPVQCSCVVENKDCSVVKTPFDDSLNKDQLCMAIARSEASSKVFDCDLGYREQTNVATSWLDLSFIYGTSDSKSNELRKTEDGLLGSQVQADLKQEYLLQDLVGKCTGETPGKACFKSGSARISQNLLATSIATLWMREHNRIARELKKLNADWNDERLYQEARRINIAQFQKIVYYDWLPAVLGSDFTSKLDFRPSASFRDMYDPESFPNTYNEVATAALRFGHSLARSSVKKVDENLNLMTTLSVKDIIYRPVEAYQNGGLNALLRGMLVDPVNTPDSHITEVLENHLFEGLSSGETRRYSLSTFTINRGRDHGLASYNKYREVCGIGKAASFESLSNIPAADIVNFKKVYKSVDDIDLFTGGISERPLPNGVVGNTFACLIGNFFYNLRKSDRFFFENIVSNVNPFTQEQLINIKSVDMKSIICRNVKLAKIQKNPFVVEGPGNDKVDCSHVPSVDLRLWKVGASSSSSADQTPISGFRPFFD